MTSTVVMKLMGQRFQVDEFQLSASLKGFLQTLLFCLSLLWKNPQDTLWEGASLWRVSSWSFAQKWGNLSIMEQPVNPSWQILRNCQASRGACISQHHTHGCLVQLLCSSLQNTVYINSTSLGAFFIGLKHGKIYSVLWKMFDGLSNEKCSGRKLLESKGITCKCRMLMIVVYFRPHLPGKHITFSFS